MKRMSALFLAAILCLCLAACGKAPEPQQSPQEQRYTDDLVDMKGTIRYDAHRAVFDGTESTSGLAEAGTTWVFPEVKEAFL